MFQPLVLCDGEARPAVEGAGFESMAWMDFPPHGPSAPR
jgi:hypothetical protein